MLFYSRDHITKVKRSQMMENSQQNPLGNDQTLIDKYVSVLIVDSVVLLSLQREHMDSGLIYSVAVKPHPPSSVKAVSHSSGVLEVTWTPPGLPPGGLQCQSRYHSPSTMSSQPDWTVSPKETSCE